MDMSRTMQREELGLYKRGQEAVDLLWRRWRERPEIDDPRDPEFARGALDEIIDRLVNSDDVDKEIREYSEAAAEQATKASRTIFEIMQNADDLGAPSLRPVGPPPRPRRTACCAWRQAGRHR